VSRNGGSPSKRKGPRLVWGSAGKPSLRSADGAGQEGSGGVQIPTSSCSAAAAPPVSTLSSSRVIPPVVTHGRGTSCRQGSMVRSGPLLLAGVLCLDLAHRGSVDAFLSSPLLLRRPPLARDRPVACAQVPAPSMRLGAVLPARCPRQPLRILPRTPPMHTRRLGCPARLVGACAYAAWPVAGRALAEHSRGADAKRAAKRQGVVWGCIRGALCSWPTAMHVCGCGLRLRLALDAHGGISQHRVGCRACVRACVRAPLWPLLLLCDEL